jgi:hypothetical protein
MARKIIDVGTVGNDGTGDSIRDSFRKVNDNFRELYSSLGLGERLTFIGLSDTPETYAGQIDPGDPNRSTPLVTVNNEGDGITFKKLVSGNGIAIDFISNPNEITINAEFAEISADPTPQLGGDLSLRSGGEQYRVIDAGTTLDPLLPVFKHELVNKSYADSKVSRAGANAINPETGFVDSSLGRMSGPLILSRSPEPEDDELYGGLIAATKQYVDNAAFGSITNLYVALSGSDDRPGVSKSLQGRALAYAYRTLESALKRAEELVNEARVEIGPYKKVLTFNNGAEDCTLVNIIPAPDSGSGFEGTIRMSVDTISLVPLTGGGTNYFPGDILTINGGTISDGGGACIIEVLTTLSTPGAISTFRIISTGSYSALPGATSISATITTSAAPEGVGGIGEGARFNITYKVNSVSIIEGGSDYSLVSVRITGGGGEGAFGTAVITAGVVTSITITDKGTGFTSLPTLEVNLPRFLIRTEGLRTDFTGDVSNETAEAIRTRDIREGLYLRGEESGALAQILSHDGSLDGSGNEIFDVDIKFGRFVNGEIISYGDITKNIQITVLVESGEYFENYPLKVPQNTSIVGDEFRRVIFRPKPGTSSSPWAFQRFRRDKTIGTTSTTRSAFDNVNNVWTTQEALSDQLTIANNEYGYHYLSDTSAPVYPKVSNKGEYRSAAALLELNRAFLQEETIAWINYNISNNISPFIAFNYDSGQYKRDIGLIVDALVFDIIYGSYNRTVSTGLKYYENDISRQTITVDILKYLDILTYLESLIQDVITNTEITTTYQDLFLQITDPAFQAELGSDTVITDLVDALKDVIDGSGSVNYPLENQEMDVFLANDAVRWQAISAQGHGGFMGVLDPDGQILAKSPYFQECSSFSRSKNRQVFAGGMFVDGFAGNLEFNIDTVISPTRLEVSDLDRFPQLPCSYIVGDTVYRINYVRDFEYNKDGSTATLILDESTPWPFSTFVYDDDACFRDTGLILDGLGYDIVFGTNYWTRLSGSTYRLAQSAVVIEDQRIITLEAIELAHELAAAEITAYPAIQTVVALSNSTIADIIDRGTSAIPNLSFTLPPGVSTNISNAYALLIANKDYIVAEAEGWIQAQIAGNISPWATSDTYSASTVQRDIRSLIEAVTHDVIYGGTLASRTAALKYYNNLTGVSLIIDGQESRTASAIDYVNYLTKQVIQNLAPAAPYSTLARISGTAASASEVTVVDTLIDYVSTAITLDNFASAQSAIPLTPPSVGAYSYNTSNVAARALIVDAKEGIQEAVIDYVNFNGNRYELLMPGNRSMLANDFTQINDMGYGVIAMNGGLVELVSVFTYYCYISYYSVTGGQIRSVAGSSAHGIYALVAEGADPLEVPTPSTIYEEMSQRAVCYFPGSTFANSINGLSIFVTGYDYTPLGGSELEIDHDGIIFRYPVSSATTVDLPPGVARLNLSAGTGGISDGLFAAVPDGTFMTLRLNSQIRLTGGLENVAVRPSTGLKLRETPNLVYRVLQFTTDVDENGPYEVLISNSNPAVFRVLTTVIEIDSDVCTTSGNHKLKIGDKFIPTSTDNGLISGAVYFITEVPNYNQFKVSLAPNGISPTLSNGTGLSIKGIKTHKLLENYKLTLTTTGSLPSPLLLEREYWVVPSNLTETEFSISTQRNGSAVATTTSGSGIHRYIPDGVTLTKLRENYNYIDLTVSVPGEFVTSGAVCTISIASPAVISLVDHGFNVDDVIRFDSTGNLPTGLSKQSKYFVISDGLTLDEFQVSLNPGGVAVDTTGTQSGTHTVGLITGRAGDIQFAVTGVGGEEISRVAGSKFVFKGEEYVINTYQPESVTNQPYARITLNRPLVDSIIAYASSYTIKSAVPIRSSGSLGTLTIRISLTRVTSHDLLEIGTGSYADTNYPKEIYGPSVNALDEAKETLERDVGRVFYVTTDQFGNFRVGPYFKVDQGTGTVTFSSSIALSNLDGLGFKRGVPIAEFSIDTGMSDGFTDTVPTELAVRGYIERRLGITHGGEIVAVEQLIPPLTGGFLPLSPPSGLTMRANLDLGNNKIINITDPTDDQDAVNLRSLTFNNLQDVTLTSPSSGSLLGFTGVGNASINLSITGDVTATRSSNTLDIQLAAGSIINSDVNDNAAIAQSKINLTLAAARESAPTGTAGEIQAVSGLVSFNNAEFEITNGWVTLKGNSIVLSDLAQISSRTVLGNSTLGSDNVSAVPFSTVVDLGGAVKKSQFASAGFLRRTSGSSFSSDADYAVVNASAGSSTTVAASELVIRDSNGDFGGRTADLQSLKIDNNLAIDTTSIATGGFVRYFGWGSAGGILIQDGSLAADKATGYWNDLHQFRTQNGVSDAPITCSSIRTLAITTGATGTQGNITGDWRLNSGSRLQATYSADLAEWYTSDKKYESGTVLVFGGDAETTTTNVRGDTRVAGVVSTDPAYVMNGHLESVENSICLALQGRVPCRVVGKIQKGDILVTAGIHGVAMAATGDVKVGTVVGKALENYDSDHIGKIEIAVGRA